MPIFSKSVVINAPVETVFAFHERDDALTLLTPAFPPVKVVRRTGGIQKGAQVELRVGPFEWIALHTDFEKDRLFVDQQVKGPFAEWVHRHEFEDLGVATLLTDCIQYRLRGGATINSLFSWTVLPGLHQMFAHRHRVTKQYCEE